MPGRAAVCQQRSGSLGEPFGAVIPGKEVGLDGLSQRVATVLSSFKGRTLGRGCGPVYALRIARGRLTWGGVMLGNITSTLTSFRKMSHCFVLW